MKNKLIKICLMFVFCLFVLNITIYAADLDVSLSSSKIEQGKTFNVSVSSGKVLTDFEVTVSVEGLQLPTISAKYTGSTTSSSGIKSIVKLFQLSAQEEKTKITAGTNLATFKYTVPSVQSLGGLTVKVTLKAIDQDKNQISTSVQKTVEITAPKSTNSYLSDLKVNEKTVNGFKKGTTSYTLATVENNVTSIKITATAEDSKAKVTGIGNKSLKVGKNTFKVVVTAESGAAKTYTIIVTRKDVDKSTNNYLSMLKVNGKTVSSFKKGTTSYTLTAVENDVTSIKITAIAEDSKAKVTGTGTKSLKVGKNTFKVAVTAESGATRTYTIIVARKDKEVVPSNNTNISSIKIDGKEYKLDNSKTNYVLDNVNYEVETLNFEVTAEDAKSKVTGAGNKQLNVGENIFEITVTAEDGTSKTLNFTVTRGEAEKPVVNENVTAEDKEVVAQPEDNIKQESNTNVWIYIVIAVTVILIIALIVITVKSRRK